MQSRGRAVAGIQWVTSLPSQGRNLERSVRCPFRRNWPGGSGSTGHQRAIHSCITSFRRALERTAIQLPQGQASHALRHSFARHFMMNGRNILTLQKILGHPTLAMDDAVCAPVVGSRGRGSSPAAAFRFGYGVGCIPLMEYSFEVIYSRCLGKLNTRTNSVSGGKCSRQRSRSLWPCRYACWRREAFAGLSP